MQRTLLATNQSELDPIYDQVLTGCEFSVSEFVFDREAASVELPLACPPRPTSRLRILPTPPRRDPNSKRMRLRFQGVREMRVTDPARIDTYELLNFEYLNSPDRWRVRGTADFALELEVCELRVSLESE